MSAVRSMAPEAAAAAAATAAVAGISSSLPVKSIAAGVDARLLGAVAVVGVGEARGLPVLEVSANTDVSAEAAPDKTEPTDCLRRLAALSFEGVSSCSM